MNNRKIRQWMMVVLILVELSAIVPSWGQEITPEEKRDLYLRGNEEWGQYCANCHAAIPPSDRAPHEWETIMQHMRVEANMPAESAQAILEYLRAR
jgi:hypothetical protein